MHNSRTQPESTDGKQCLFEIHPKKSELLDGVVSLMCQSCIDAKYEPRWVIVLAVRSKGASYVRDAIAF